MEGDSALRIYQKRTGKLPPALESMPAPGVDTKFYLDCFYRLSSSRLVHESGPQALQISETLAYANLLGYTAQDDILFFLDVIQAVDHTYLEVMQKKIASQREAAAMKSKSSLKTK